MPLNSNFGFVITLIVELDNYMFSFLELMGRGDKELGVILVYSVSHTMNSHTASAIHANTVLNTRIFRNTRLTTHEAEHITLMFISPEIGLDESEVSISLTVAIRN